MKQPINPGGWALKPLCTSIYRIFEYSLSSRQSCWRKGDRPSRSHCQAWAGHQSFRLKVNVGLHLTSDDAKPLMYLTVTLPGENQQCYLIYNKTSLSPLQGRGRCRASGRRWAPSALVTSTPARPRRQRTGTTRTRNFSHHPPTVTTCPTFEKSIFSSSPKYYKLVVICNWYCRYSDNIIHNLGTSSQHIHC